MARSHIAAQKWCRAQPATEMVVITDDWITSRGIGNINLLRAAADQIADTGITQFMVNAFLTSSRLLLSEIVEAAAGFGLTQPKAISSVLKLCSSDLCHFDITQPLTRDTVIYEGRRNRIFVF
jgi:hypothetical protein